MANVPITGLPAAQPITGTELVPVVQNGITVRTTTAAISSAPNQTQTFVTVNQEPTLPNSRSFSGANGVGITDNGAQSTLRVSLNGTSGSLETSGAGIIAKTAGNVVAPRTLTTSGLGLSVTDGNGNSGNPTFQLTGIAAAIAQASGTGMLAIVGGTSIAGRQLYGTVNQIAIANGDGSGNPTISITDNPVLPGTGAVTLPSGTNAQQPAGVNGQIRFNTTTGAYEGYVSSAWKQFAQSGGVTSFNAGTTGLTPSSDTSGAVVLNGVLNVEHGGTGSTTLTGYLVGNGVSPVTAVTTIPNAGLTNSAVTVNGTSVSLGGSASITAASPAALTISTGLSGSSYTGSSPVTIAIDSTVATLTGSQTLTNKTLTSPAITGGSVNNTTIGNTTPSSGVFTSIGTTSGTITNLPTGSTDIANKAYVDSIASGVNFHESCNYATTAVLPAYVYNNGASGVGATITASVNGVLSVDGGSPSTGQRVMVKNEAGASQAYNGVYVVTAPGSVSTKFVLTRSTDYNTSGSGVNQINSGDFFFIISGTVNGNTSWVQQTALPITVGVTALVFTQFAAPIVYSAGTGLNLSTTVFSIANTGVTSGSYGLAASVPTLGINAQGQITSAVNTAIAVDASQVSTGTLPVLRGGTGVTTSTGSGSVVLNTSPTLVTPALGTPSSGTVTNLTGTANITATGGASGAIAATTLSASSTVSGTGFSTYLASPPAIGGTAPAAVSATALSYTTTLTGGTGIVNLGSGQFYKDASGNVGIGVTPNGATLDVLADANTGAIAVRGRSADNLASIQFKNNTAAAQYAFIQSGPTYLGIGVNSAERMRIDASGNVGIGVTPGTKLQALGIIKSGGTGTNGEFNLARTSDGLSVGKITLTESTQILDYNNLLGGGVHTFTINSVERMRIDSSGNVGIGTSSPGTKLSVVSATNAGISVSDGTVNTIIYNSTGGAASIGTTTNHRVAFYQNNTERMRLDLGANLLVGITTTPTVGTNVTGNIVVPNDISSGSLLLGTNGSYLGRNAGDGSTVLNTGQASIIFSRGVYGSAPTTSMVIDNSGNVGIGVTSPGTKLDVNGAITGRATAGGEGGQLELNNPDNLSTGLVLDVSTADTGRLFQVRNNSYLQIGQLAGTGGLITFFTAASERMRIASDGTVTVGGNLNAGNVGTAGTVYAKTSTASSATAAQAISMGSGAINVHFGTGAPTHSSAQGSLYIRTDGSSATTRLYINTNGTTGWTYLTAGA